MFKRVFVIVLDSFGCGEMPDSADFGDEGSNTLRAVASSEKFSAPSLTKLGIFNIDGVSGGNPTGKPIGAYGKMAELSRGKDTTTGHWEIAGLISTKAMPTFPDGFPQEFIDRFSAAVGRKCLCNKPYSGTKVILDYGKEHLDSGALIVYTSGDSVFQIAAHESVVPIETLYEYCETARKMLTGSLAVGRVIARPFVGEYPNFTRTSNRHDFSLKPTGVTVLDEMKNAGLDVISIGKINDIFAGAGITKATRTISNEDGMAKTLAAAAEDFCGLCFTNLVDYDMLYGHRNDVDGYAAAITRFDEWLPKFRSAMCSDDLLIITADHGCDPSTPSTDHSREYVPLLVCGNRVKPVNLGTIRGFGAVGKTIEENFRINGTISGESFLKEIEE